MTALKPIFPYYVATSPIVYLRWSIDAGVQGGCDLAVAPSFAHLRDQRQLRTHHPSCGQKRTAKHLLGGPSHL
jgi:hypothetical protein